MAAFGTLRRSVTATGTLWQVLALYVNFWHSSTSSGTPRQPVALCLWRPVASSGTTYQITIPGKLKVMILGMMQTGVKNIRYKQNVVYQGITSLLLYT